jgi:N-acetylglutamate synthase-like GNAT family acetyltransferase
MMRRILMNNISVRINNTDTQDNANGLYIRILEADEITDIYNEHIVTDFPASEVKPLSQMLRKREQGQYFVYGMFEDNGELAGYAYFIKCSNKDVYLLDYLAIVKNKRSKHLGSTFLQELKNIAVNDDRLLMLEVENPDYADEGAAKDYMIKRIGFNSCKNVEPKCFERLFLTIAR